MKRPPAWLAAFHRQWLAVRGRKAEGKALPFARDWEALLDVSGLKAAEDRAAAICHEAPGTVRTTFGGL